MCSEHVLGDLSHVEISQGRNCQSLLYVYIYVVFVRMLYVIQRLINVFQRGPG